GIERTDYVYGPGAQVTDKKEWDWGQAPACGSSPSVTPLRETQITYQSFPATPIFPSAPSVFDRPATVTVYGSGTQASQTTYGYSQGVTPAGITVGRDANYNGNSTVPRGNVTTMTQWLNVGGTSPVTTYRSEEHTSELQSRFDLVCRLLL